MTTKAIPKGYHAITPYITVEGATGVIDFLKEAFGATERFRLDYPEGGLMHAELEIGDSVVMLSEPGGECKPMPASLYLYVDDVDAAYEQAIQAGATPLMEPADQFYGDRLGVVEDRAGNRWSIATHIEDLSPEELKRRGEQFMKEHPKP